MNTARNNADIWGSLSSGSGYNLISFDTHFVRNASPGDDGVWGTGDDNYGDFHLRIDSPTINQGNNDLALNFEGNPLVADLDGKQRIIYGVVDIGAYEFCMPGDFNLDGNVDNKDLDILKSG